MSSPSGSTKSRFAAAGMLLAALLAGAGYLAGTSGVLTADTKAPAISPADPSVAHANALSHAFRKSADRVLPAVVAISNEARPRTVQRELRTPRGGRQLPKEFEELDPFLKKFFEGGPSMGQPGDQFDEMPSIPRQSAGS